MEEVSFIVEAIAAGLFIFCLLAGMGACFYIMENGFGFKRKKKNGDSEN
jgi:hypothetical protein